MEVVQMAKKSKQANSKKEIEKLTINNISIGMSIPDSTKNPQDWEITDDLIEQMRSFEQQSNKSAIWRNKITGHFLYFKYIEEHPEFLEDKKKSSAKKKGKAKEIEVEAQNEKEIEDGENLMLDAIEDYKTEFGVKKVNTNTKKFKTFFEEWKDSK